jgi:radical SAM protein with 4Fe4S-binding SPASM domain
MHHDSPDYDEAPRVLTWEVTQACTLECDHCRAEAKPDRHPEELSTAEGKALLEAVARFDPSPVLVFSGGDPLERPDLFDLVEYARSLDLTTAVTPAPTGNLDRATVERFAAAGVHRMALSLDGATPERHDAFRGEAGSFEAIRRAADWADDAGLSLQVNTTVTARTAHDLSGVADLVADLGAVTWEVFFLVPVGRGETLEALDPVEAEQVLTWLYRRAREAPYRVITVEAPQYRRVAATVEQAESGGDARVGSTRAGKGFLFVGHTGDVYPSGFLPTAVGNVREDDVVSLYREAPLLERLRDADSFGGPCGDCRWRTRCGGSRSRAAATTGDPLASDPLCPLVARGDGATPSKD